MTKKRKMKKKASIFIFLIVLIAIGSLVLYYLGGEDTLASSANKILNQKKYEEEQKLLEEQKLEEERLANINVCYDVPQSSFELSTDFITKLSALENYSGTYSIVYSEIEDDNLLLTYNSERVFYGESTVKLPFAMYIYELAESDSTLLDKEIYFKESNRVGGSGIMQNMDLTRAFSIRELVKYMVEDSDNIAFFMLIDEFGKTDTKTYWSSYGATTTFIGGDNFGTFSGDDAVIYLTKLYEIIESGNAHYADLIDSALAASKSSVMKDVIGEELYFKYGGPSGAYHELFIVDSEKPYLLSVLTEIETLNYKTFLPIIAEEVKSLHEMYWEEKMIYCEGLYPQEGEQ